MLRAGGTSKTYESVQLGRGQKLMNIEHTHFLNSAKSMDVYVAERKRKIYGFRHFWNFDQISLIIICKAFTVERGYSFNLTL